MREVVEEKVAEVGGEASSVPVAALPAMVETVQARGEGVGEGGALGEGWGVGEALGEALGEVPGEGLGVPLGSARPLLQVTTRTWCPSSM